MIDLPDTRVLAVILAAVAAGATAFTVAMPLLEGDPLGRRMKAVATERERIRARERERLVKNKVTLRQAPKAYMKQIVDRFQLGQWLGTDNARRQLTMAGFRGGHSEVAFLFFRLIAPIGFLASSLFYLFLVEDFGLPVLARLAISIAATLLGIKSPEIYLKNVANKRRASIRRAWPDALDLLLICVESGMAIEGAMRRVGAEVGLQSVALAEELTLTTAERS